MAQILVKDKQYAGKYVAIEDFGSSKVVGNGQTPQEAYKEATLRGYSNPVIVFVPLKNLVQIY